MPSIIDKEFGEITVRKSALSRLVKIRVGTNGRLVISAPKRTTLIYLKTVIASSRDQLRSLLAAPIHTSRYQHGQKIGRSYTLAIVETGMVHEPEVRMSRNHIVAKIPHNTDPSSLSVQQKIRDAIIRALRSDAKKYLPPRLDALARQGGFSYQRVRLSHAAGRWGSCSSTGTISLNIALMKLPEALTDYVLIHELCHTVHMDHSQAFWSLVERFDPSYKSHRQQLKRFAPNV